jgi:hypothetical protein
MKTMAKGSTDILNRINSPFIINKSNVEIKLMDFHKVNRYYVLLLNVMNLSDDNYRIFLKGHYLSLIISEPKEVSKPVHIHNMDWNLYNNQSYEILKSVDVWLPGDNFYLIKHYLLSEDQVLKVFLGKMHFN